MINIKIVSVALNVNGIILSLPRPNRHYHVLRLLSEIDRNLSISCHDEFQGFLTNDGKFVNRIEAAKIALEAGQIKTLIAPPKLYSEDLW